MLAVLEYSCGDGMKISYPIDALKRVLQKDHNNIKKEFSIIEKRNKQTNINGKLAKTWKKTHPLVLFPADFPRALEFVKQH